MKDIGTPVPENVLSETNYVGAAGMGFQTNRQSPHISKKTGSEHII